MLRLINRTLFSKYGINFYVEQTANPSKIIYKGIVTYFLLTFTFSLLFTPACSNPWSRLPCCKVPYGEAVLQRIENSLWQIASKELKSPIQELVRNRVLPMTNWAWVDPGSYQYQIYRGSCIIATWNLDMTTSWMTLCRLMRVPESGNSAKPHAYSCTTNIK